MDGVTRAEARTLIASLLSAEQAADGLAEILNQAVDNRTGRGTDRGVLHAAGNGVIPAGTLSGFFTQLVVPGTALSSFLLAGFPLSFFRGGRGSLLLRFQRFGIHGDRGGHIVSGSGIQHHVHHLLYILAGGLVQHHDGHLLGLHLDSGNCLLDSLHYRLGSLLNRLHNGLGGLLDSLHNGLSRLLDCLYDGLGTLLHRFDHGRRGLLDSLNHRSGSFLNSFHYRSGGFLDSFRNGSHAFNFFFNILTGGRIKNLECCHLLSAALSPCAVQGVVG